MGSGFGHVGTGDWGLGLGLDNYLLETVIIFSIFCLVLLIFGICCCGRCQKKKSTAKPVERAGDDAAILIQFKKKEDQKTKIVNSTEFEKNRFEECENLEAKVAE